MFISSGEHSRTRAPGKAVISTKCHGPFEEWFTRRVRVGAWARARACVRPDVYNRWCTLWANARTYLPLGRQRVAPDGSNQCLLSKRHLGRADVRIPLPTTHDKTHLLVYGRRTMRSICSLTVASSGGSSHLDVRLLTTSDVNDLVSSSSVTVRSLIWGGVAVFAAPHPLGASATSLDAVRLLTDSANCNHHTVEFQPKYIPSPRVYTYDASLWNHTRLVTFGIHLSKPVSGSQRARRCSHPSRLAPRARLAYKSPWRVTAPAYRSVEFLPNTTFEKRSTARRTYLLTVSLSTHNGHSSGNDADRCRQAVKYS